MIMSDVDHDRASANTACRDDTEVEDAELLWRLVETTPAPVAAGGKVRPVSGSFRDQHGKMSVNRAKLSTLEHTLFIQPDSQIAQFTAADVRQLTYKVYADPVYVCLACRRDIGPDSAACPKCGSEAPVYHNQAHAIVCPKITEGNARRIAKERAELLTISAEIRERARDKDFSASGGQAP